MTTITVSRPATVAEMQAEIDRLTAAHALQYDEIERLRAVVDAAEGLCMGDDWNKGTHAKIHRPRLIRALAHLKPNAAAQAQP